jgi:hypothetical protein
VFCGLYLASHGLPQGGEFKKYIKYNVLGELAQFLDR